mgnify:CR=1 FL=1
MNITVPRVREKIIAVNLLRVVCDTRFLLIRIIILLVSQKSKSLQSTHYTMPCRLEAKSVSPNNSPMSCKNKMFRMRVKLLEIKANGSK